MKRLARYAERGLLALAPQAWGGEFAIVMGAPEAPPPFVIEGGVAVVDVRGPLSQHESWCWDSYDAIRTRIDAALASEAPAVVLRIDSPGGDAAGAFELSRELRAKAKAAGKRLLAYADGCAASAAYAIACAAEAIFVSATAQVGSVGVIAASVDQTAMDQAFGLRYAVVASGARKADGNPHVPITDGAIAALQAQVDTLAGMFFALVEEQRGVAAAKLAKLEGALLLGVQAVGVGLADGVMTWAQALASASGGATSAASAATEDRMDKDELMKALRAAAEGDDEGAKEVAKKALKALDGDEKKDDAKAKAEDEKKEPEAKAKAEGEDEKKEAKAEDEKKEDEKAKATAGAPDVFELARTVHQLKAERAAEKEAAERAELLAKRPDFSPEIVKTLASLPIEKVREAVETWARMPGKAGGARAAAATAVGTRGATQHDDAAASVDESEASFVAAKMGAHTEAAGVERKGRALVLGPMTPEAANKRLLELQKGAA